MIVSVEKAELNDFGAGSLITGTDIAEAVKQLCTPGVNEILRVPQHSGCCRASLADTPAALR